MLPRAPQAPTTHCFSLPGVTRMSAGFPFAPRVSLRGLACHEERGPVPREEGGGRLRHGGTHSLRPAHGLLSGQRHSVRPLSHCVGTEAGNRVVYIMNANERGRMQSTRKCLHLLEPALLVFVLPINSHEDARGFVWICVRRDVAHSGHFDEHVATLRLP